MPSFYAKLRQKTSNEAFKSAEHRPISADFASCPFFKAHRQMRAWDGPQRNQTGDPDTCIRSGQDKRLKRVLRSRTS